MTWEKNWGSQICIWTNHKTCGTMSFGWIRPGWICVFFMCSAMFGKTKHSISSATPTPMSSMVIKFGSNWAEQQGNNLRKIHFRTAEKLKDQSFGVALSIPQFKCFGRILREMWIWKCLQFSMNQSNVVKQNGPNSISMMRLTGSRVVLTDLRGVRPQDVAAKGCCCYSVMALLDFAHIIFLCWFLSNK